MGIRKGGGVSNTHHFFRTLLSLDLNLDRFKRTLYQMLRLVSSYMPLSPNLKFCTTEKGVLLVYRKLGLRTVAVT